jgi:hypothetical protein
MVLELQQRVLIDPENSLSLIGRLSLISKAGNQLLLPQDARFAFRDETERQVEIIVTAMLSHRTIAPASGLAARLL